MNRRESGFNNFAAGGPGGAGGLAILSTTVPISSAQILSLNATPVPLLPTPGPNSVYRIIAFQWNFIAGNTPYTIVGVGTLQLADNLLATTLISITPSSSGWVNALGTNAQAGNIGGTMSIQPSSKIINKPLVLWVAGASPAGGNGTGIVTIEYYVASCF